MRFYDITQELFSSNVYPGDKAPVFRRISDMADGKICNITEIEQNAHNGTHIDAPRHFVRDGITIEQIPLETLIGAATVHTFDHEAVSAEDIRSLKGKCAPRLLLKGGCWLDKCAAEALEELEIVLVGVECQSMAEEKAPAAVHVEVLSRGIIGLEGLVLTDVPDGDYFLFAPPVKMGGSDGAPCRAVLMTKE